MKGIGKLKSNRGVTLTALVIYVMGLAVVITLMAMILKYFYRNVNDVTISQNADEQYSKFLAYLTKDANSDNLIYVQARINDEENVVFKFNNQVEHQYILKSGNIYYINIENNNEKKIILCENVSSSKVFNYSNNKLDVNFIINDKKFSTSLNIKNIE